jgi:uncharacterized membrane protein YdjX (TVP38/TMEM64 family)
MVGWPWGRGWNGGTLVFLMGGAEALFPGSQTYQWTSRLRKRWPAVLVTGRREEIGVVFVMSAMLNPAFAPMAIAMGAMRFRLIKFFLMCVAGNVVKAMLISYAGYLGLGTILRWISGL